MGLDQADVRIEDIRIICNCLSISPSSLDNLQIYECLHFH